MNPFIGTFIGWILSFLCGRISSAQQELITYWTVKNLIPSWAVGQTWGRIILIKEGYDSTSLRKHELVHTVQWQRLGWFGFGFIAAYLWESIIHGYANNKYEKEAEGN